MAKDTIFLNVAFETYNALVFISNTVLQGIRLDIVDRPIFIF